MRRSERLDALTDARLNLSDQTTALLNTSGERLSYRQLYNLSNNIAACFEECGIEQNARIAILSTKCMESLAAQLACLASGCTYVPVWNQNPIERIRFILKNADVSAVIFHQDESARIEELFPEVSPIRVSSTEHLYLILTSYPQVTSSENKDIACILYTSGSTGTPKGVVISDEAIKAFVNWCRHTFMLTASDRTVSIAPFHFDLSLFDIYYTLSCGASLLLLNDQDIRNPMLAASLISEYNVSCIYATPSFLSGLAHFGKLHKHDFTKLRQVLFAGEVFPIKALNNLRNQLPKALYYNLYGPTETNVCTWYQLSDVIDEDRSEPYPIGKACSHMACCLINTEGEQILEPETPGELLIGGLSLMERYWGDPERTAQSLLEIDKTLYYKSGDWVKMDIEGNYVYLGRKDRMVKRRGYRIELAEIEIALEKIPDLQDLAVVSVPDHEGQVRIIACLVMKGQTRPDLLSLKSFCLKHLTDYMMPDQFIFRDELPLSSSGKKDLQSLIQSLKS